MCPVINKHWQSDNGVLRHLRVASRGFSIGAIVAEDMIQYTNQPYEHVGSGRIATGSVIKSTTCADINHFSINGVERVWLPRDDPTLLLAGTAPGWPVMPPDWPTMVVRVDFTELRSFPILNKRNRRIRGGCPECGSFSWHRHQ